MTVMLYPAFVEVAKDQSNHKIDEEEVVARLKAIVDQLPPANLKTAAMIIHHLKRFARLFSYQNTQYCKELDCCLCNRCCLFNKVCLNDNSYIIRAVQTVNVLLTKKKCQFYAYIEIFQQCLDKIKLQIGLLVELL